ncbi:MAG: hypothetical protein AUJ52_09710 [Elusimicrobia bacterium CG1_02_63_36]|nr:MAG: hypothetical protein AUJ52_09710 [Elusimicrobia bacterium CG1_02_63_36]PIP83529.1 MAG: hypothetical protein COR54_08730 [Elusimicrobia bacterium CG22_combo_CG10-13_8_21_14_all_63_91]PJA13109.1 MAG: hypothetical protein COX66_15580 [Elusimicrobia bacterium CG_4_10_14_0_2_um_filter_63_34]PJB26034.1 MAG: hypothetical protein CO113_05335 [Elusimicrobia bacterium CG_4_9_14_3_um_filter_62_55]
MRALLPLALSAAGALSGPIPDFPETRKLEIIKLIWQREGGGTVRGLAQWNDGETFASIGAAHYLWYPDYELCGGTKPGFEESLPALIEWMISERRVDPSELPTALGADGTGRIRPAPWCTRRMFLSRDASPELAELRAFFSRRDVLVAQADFQIRRLSASLDSLVRHDPVRAGVIQRSIDAVAASERGVVAMLDYVGFKGEGLKATERTPNGFGWGLFQVLLEMERYGGLDGLDRFKSSAKFVLERRAGDDPSVARFLRGWLKRVDEY